MADAPITNELMYDLLKRIQADIASLRGEVRAMRGEMSSLKSHLLGLIQSDLTRDGEIAGIRPVSSG